jgi:hypothetical protein
MGDRVGTEGLRVDLESDHTGKQFHRYVSLDELEKILTLLAHNSEAQEFINFLPFHVITESQWEFWELQEQGMNLLLEEGELLLNAAKEEVGIKWHWPLVAYFHRLEDVIGGLKDQIQILLHGTRKEKT